MLILCQTRKPGSGRLQVRGLFTQKKKLWDAIQASCPRLDGFSVFNDVTGKSRPLVYSRFLTTIAESGRATLVDGEGRRMFLVIETEVNVLREWDTDDEGKPRANISK